ncbi:hypothetical protein CLV40_12728 [Actinokineospora auranticolor]|uniref:Uncharacterized protein n=2 Tax=Actinokineospora auranticolor TaxID=155976 RepID=A0A2S6GED7_9PSEU|nr:hypothetical protein CLV40_12728 [Actinokineospora auranticolor]
MNFPIPVQIGKFREVTVWALYHWRHGGTTPERAAAGSVSTPFIHALFSDDRCYCGGICTLVPADVGPCPGLERRALLARDMFHELYSDFKVQLGQFTMPGYLTDGGRRVEVVARLLYLDPED